MDDAMHVWIGLDNGDLIGTYTRMWTATRDAEDQFRIPSQPRPVFEWTHVQNMDGDVDYYHARTFDEDGDLHHLIVRREPVQ